MSAKHNRIFRMGTLSLVLCALALLYNNCGAKHEGEQTTASSELGGNFTCADQLDKMSLFSRTYHPFLMNTCASCHQGAGPGPHAFASSGVQLAFDSFDQNVGYSKINTFAVNNHSTAAGSGNQITVDKLAALWVEGLETIEYCKTVGDDGSGLPSEDQDGANRIRTFSKAINPDRTRPSTITWNVGTDLIPGHGLNLGTLPGVQIQVDVEIFERPGLISYVVSNPRIRTTQTDVHIKSILVKVNNQAAPSQRAFYFVDTNIRSWNAQNPLFRSTDPNMRNRNDAISSGSLVIAGEVRTTDVISLSIETVESVVLPPPIEAPEIRFVNNTLSVTESSGVISVDLELSKTWNELTSAEVTFGPETTIDDQCCISSTNSMGMNISPDLFRRDIQDFDSEKSLTLNNRVNFNFTGSTGRYRVSFAAGETRKSLRLKIVQDQRVEPTETLHLIIDPNPNRLIKLKPGATNQATRISITDDDITPLTGPYRRTYTRLMGSGGILFNQCLRCHNSVDNQGGYDITNYEEMVRKGVLVPMSYAQFKLAPEFPLPINEVNRVKTSIMFQRIEGNIPGLQPMPLSGTLNPTDRREIMDWIEEGAFNN